MVHFKPGSLKEKSDYWLITDLLLKIFASATANFLMIFFFAYQKNTYLNSYSRLGSFEYIILNNTVMTVPNKKVHIPVLQNFGSIKGFYKYSFVYTYTQWAINEIWWKRIMFKTKISKENYKTGANQTRTSKTIRDRIRWNEGVSIFCWPVS